jgi:predicted nucleotidyltransferase component of viral defense system
MIKEWIAEYQPTNEEELLAALREIMQEITLAGLARTDFFENAAFYGGTALRIFYGLDRFSEDLDFSLLNTNEAFSLEPYFSAIQTEFAALGITVSFQEKEKTKRTAIESAFLKTETIWTELVLEDILKQTGIRSNKSIKIKIEIDRNPPVGFKTEQKLLLRPFSFYVKCYTRPSLFAGKLHALLFRKWNKRVKGRDWYDLEWYIKQRIPLDTNHFLKRAIASNDWKDTKITSDEINNLLRQKIENVSISSIKEDVVRFIYDDSNLDIWSAAYFKDLVDQMKFNSSNIS